ncbi:MAG: hypothetical protein RBR77_06080, partial [Thauera sp.]|nr:hypothetical protein [Thauera sp.]
KLSVQDTHPRYNSQEHIPQLKQHLQAFTNTNLRDSHFVSVWKIKQLDSHFVLCLPNCLLAEPGRTPPFGKLPLCLPEERQRIKVRM